MKQKQRKERVGKKKEEGERETEKKNVLEIEGAKVGINFTGR